MNLITVNFSERSLKEQLNFLIRQEFIVVYSKYRSVPYYLMGATVLILSLLLFADSDSLIILKGVLSFLLGLAWIVCLIFIMTMLVRFYNRIRWRNKSLRSIKYPLPNLSISFDEEKITIITDTYTSEVKWTYYAYYEENKNSIFLFPKENLYGAIYYSSNEVGIENYRLLLETAKSKLVPLASRQRNFL